MRAGPGDYPVDVADSDMGVSMYNGVGGTVLYNEVWPDTNAILTAPFAGRNPYVRRGTRTQGCNEGAKLSTDVTHWPDPMPMARA